MSKPAIRGKCLGCGAPTSEPKHKRCVPCANRAKAEMMRNRPPPEQYVVTAGDPLLPALARYIRRVAADRQCSVEAAILMLNYSPAQIERMAA